MKYQLADQVNGNFGDVYSSYEEAEKALQEQFEEHIDGEMENLAIMAEENPNGLLPSDEDHEYVKALQEGEDIREVAKRRMAGFMEIVEICSAEDGEFVRQMTEAGWAYILQEDDAPIKLAVLESCDVGTKGSITLGRLEEKGKPGTWCLFWQWGGDWMVFGDDARYNAEEIAGWEPDAIREALESIKGRDWDLGDDMEWFADWADAAEATKEEQE